MTGRGFPLSHGVKGRSLESRQNKLLAGCTLPTQLQGARWSARAGRRGVSKLTPVRARARGGDGRAPAAFRSIRECGSGAEPWLWGSCLPCVGSGMSDRQLAFVGRRRRQLRRVVAMAQINADVFSRVPGALEIVVVVGAVWSRGPHSGSH